MYSTLTCWPFHQMELWTSSLLVYRGWEGVGEDRHTWFKESPWVRQQYGWKT